MLELKAGDKVVRALTDPATLTGGTTYSIVEIEEVNKKGIFIEGCDGDISKDSIYGYDFKGAALNWSIHEPINIGNNCYPCECCSCITGFRSELLRLATESDLKEFEGS